MSRVAEGSGLLSRRLKNHRWFESIWRHHFKSLEVTMANSLEEQAIRPRGNTTREKLQFMVNWYEKTAKNDANDPYQRRFLDATGAWVEEGKHLLQNTDDKLAEAIHQHIQDINDQKNNDAPWMKNGMTRQYILIELPRTMVP
jgi:hypothetical protein